MGTHNAFRIRNTRSAKLNQAEVQMIREKYAAGGVTQGELAREYSISIVQIGRILRRESWQTLADGVPSKEAQDAVLKRLIKTQEEVNAGLDTPEGRAAAIAQEQAHKAGEGDRLLKELSLEEITNKVAHRSKAKSMEDIVAQLKEKIGGEPEGESRRTGGAYKKPGDHEG